MRKGRFTEQIVRIPKEGEAGAAASGDNATK
jgi:hypothetical protein